MGGFIVAAVSLLVTLSFTSLLLNGFCLNVIRTCKNMLKKPSTLLITNLLSLQLFQACFVLPFYISSLTDDKTSTTWSRNVCNGFRFSYMIAFYGTSLGVFLTSIDRFLAVFWIMKYKTYVTKQRAKQAIILLWFYLLVVCTVPFTYSPEDDNEFVAGCTDNGHHTKCSYNQPNSWLISMLCLNTIFPYILMVFIYVYVVRSVKDYEERAIARTSTCLHVSLPNQVVITIKKKDMTKHKKITKLAYLLCIAYAILWAPSAIFYTLKHLCPLCFSPAYKKSCMTVYIEFIVNFIAFLNLVAVPTIYCFNQKEFRSSARICRKRDIDIEEKKLMTSDL